MNKEEYQYVSSDKFRKMNRSEKMKMQQMYFGVDKEIEISTLVLIPTNSKMDGWRIGAFFAETKNGWCRLGNYDCWRVITDIENPVPIRYSLVKGDFEYGGICIFGFGDGNKQNKVTISYGGEIRVTKK